METRNNIIKMLEEAGIRATANRILVLGTLLDAVGPMSMKEIENEISTLDKSSIYRCLTLMRDNDLLHVLDGDSDGIRYEVCRGHHHNGHDSDEHVHFHCEVCGKTFCFEDIAVPRIAVPEGYEVNHTEHTVKGTCPDCRVKK